MPIKVTKSSKTLFQCKFFRRSNLMSGLSTLYGHQVNLARDLWYITAPSTSMCTTVCKVEMLSSVFETEVQYSCPVSPLTRVTVKFKSPVLGPPLPLYGHPVPHGHLQSGHLHCFVCQGQVKSGKFWGQRHNIK